MHRYQHSNSSDLTQIHVTDRIVTVSEALREEGIKVTFTRAGEHPDSNIGAPVSVLANGVAMGQAKGSSMAVPVTGAATLEFDAPGNGLVGIIRV